MNCLSVLLLCCMNFLASFGDNEYDIDYNSASLKRISTTYGDVQGFSMPLVTDRSQYFEAFVGIPYAKPPTGENRWRAPEKPDAWTGSVYNVTSFRPCCTQVLDNIRAWSFGPEYNSTSEDCLYLNVFRVLNSSQVNTRQPVFVWIHGGAYRYGSGEEYDARILAQQGIVVVTINYRLGMFGFLSTDDENASGNFGMLDMVLALTWVHENIDAFGGDPESVTVAGQSAGGGAVSLLIFSELTRGLIKRVIPQSGSALSNWAIYRPPDTNLPRAQELATKVGCPTTPSSELLDCLRQKDADVLVNTYVSGSRFNSAWAPRVDGYFIKDIPENLLASGDFLMSDLLTGTVPDEVSDEYPDTPNIEIGFNRTDKESRMYTWSRRFDAWADLMYSSVVHEYDWPGNDPAKHRDLYLEMRTDYEYIGPHHAHATGHSRVVQNTFLYSFEYLSANNPWPQWMGVPHAEELYYIFGTPFWPNQTTECPWGCHNIVWYPRQASWTEADKEMSRRMMASWSNFVKTGIPSDDWKAFQSVSEDYMEIGSRWRNSTFYKYPRTNFWNVYKPKLLNFTTPSEGVPCNDVSAASNLSRYHILIAALLFICTQTMNAFSL